MKKGFTLIELLAVVLMISVLTAIAVPQYRSSINRSRSTEAKQMLPAIYDATERWMLENNTKSTTGLTFSQLDVSMKGAASGTDSWRTPNFKYTFQKVSNGTITDNAVAEFVKTGNPSTGAKITYTGSTFSCTSPTSNASACTSLGF